MTDVTIPDGTEVDPNSKFVKIWKLRNNGSVEWPRHCRVAFLEGDRLTEGDSFPLPAAVPVGQEIDVWLFVFPPRSRN